MWRMRLLLLRSFQAMYLSLINKFTAGNVAVLSIRLCSFLLDACLIVHPVIQFGITFRG